MNIKWRWATVDPGISGTGWAEFEGKRIMRWGVIRGKGKDFVEKSKDVKSQMPWMNVRKRFIEWPSFQSTVAVNTQSLNKLCFLIGYLHCAAAVLVPVSKWRGNCPKEVLWRRAERYFRLKQGVLKNHEGDAVAIGQFLIENKLVDIS